MTLAIDATLLGYYPIRELDVSVKLAPIERRSRMLNLRDICAFVTGASGGIGREFVLELLRRGASRVYAADKVAVDTGVLDCNPKVVPLELDITDEEAVGLAAARSRDVQLLINSAGINLRAPFIATRSLAAARREMETNYFGTLAMCRAFAPTLATHKNKGGSAIVNVASILGKVTLPNLGSYCASKAAILRLSEGVRAELAPQGTHVVLVLPWAVDTPMSSAFQGKKTPAVEVAARTLDGVENGLDDVLLHEYSFEIERRLGQDAKRLEYELAATFRKAP